MKKFSIILAVLLVALLLASIPVMSASAADDEVTFDFVAGASADNTYGEQGFFGPYTDMNAATLEVNTGLVFDASVTDAWVTAEVCPQEMGAHQYAVLEIGTNDPVAIGGFTMSFGGTGGFWEQWVNYDGYTVPALDTTYKTVCIDLYASGIRHIVNDGPDFAMNKGEAVGGKICIKSIKFTDEIPANAAPGSGIKPSGSFTQYDDDYFDDDFFDDDDFDYSDDEGVLNPDGSITYEDGTILYPDGSVGLGDGVILTADGKQLIFSDGTIFNSDGKFIKPDGTVIDPGDFEYTDDGLLFENGILITDDGKVIYPDSNNNNSAINKTSIKGKGSDTPNPNTGVEGIAIALAVSALALGGLAVSKKIR